MFTQNIYVFTRVLKCVKRTCSSDAFHNDIYMLRHSFRKIFLLFFLFISEALDDFINSHKPLISVDSSMIDKLLHQNSNNNSDSHTPITPNKDQLNDPRWLGKKRRHKKTRKTEISDLRGEVCRMRYEEKLSLSQIQEELKKTYNREVDRSTIYAQTKIDNPQKNDE